MKKHLFQLLTLALVLLYAPAGLAGNVEADKSTTGTKTEETKVADPTTPIIPPGTDSKTPTTPASTDNKSEDAASLNPVSSDGAAEKSKGAKVSDDESVSLPRRVTSLVAGIVIGAPIASVRRALGEDAEAAQTVTYGNKHSGLRMAARILLLPVCLVPGAIEGVSYAVENSCKYCGTKPFSKKSFSLGKLGEDEN